MVDEDKLFDSDEEETDPDLLDDEEGEEDMPEVAGDEDEEEEVDELHPQHLNSAGFGVEEDEY